MKVRERGIDRFEGFFGADLSRASFVGSRLVLHRGDAVVLVAVVPRLDGSPGELVRLSFFISKRHRRDVLDSFVTRFPRCDIDRSEDFDFDVDRWPFHWRFSLGDSELVWIEHVGSIQGEFRSVWPSINRRVVLLSENSFLGLSQCDIKPVHDESF